MKVREIILNSILEQLKNGVAPWDSPFFEYSELPQNFITGRNYTGVNFILLNERNKTPFWLTWNQIKAAGAQVKKGAKSEIVVFWRFLNDDEENEDRRAIMKFYRVFNVADTTLEYPEPQLLEETDKAAEKVETALCDLRNRLGIRLKTSQIAAYYPLLKRIDMPPKNRFRKEAEYLHVLIHEHAHATKIALEREAKKEAKNRLEKYSVEELTADIAAAMLCRHFGVKYDTARSAAYCAGWAEKAKLNKNLIFRAASDAQKVFDLITGKDSASEAAA